MANERNYRGPALLVLDGDETEVSADLTVHEDSGREEWRGTLSGADPNEDFVRFADRPATLRIPETGGEAEVRIRGWGSRLVRAEGSGGAPF